jgi:group I intron endonuclease
MKYKTPIHNALLKYGYSKFTLEILEYCENTDPVVREQFYLDLLHSEYNILAVTYSSLGFKHSKETLEFFTNRIVSENTKKNLSLAATGRILTEEDKKKISNARKGIELSDEVRAKISATIISKIGIPVIIKNKNTMEEIEYINLTEAAKGIGVSRTSIKKALDSGRLIQKLYYVATKNKKEESILISVKWIVNNYLGRRTSALFY